MSDNYIELLKLDNKRTFKNGFFTNHHVTCYCGFCKRNGNCSWCGKKEEYTIIIGRTTGSKTYIPSQCKCCDKVNGGIGVSKCQCFYCQFIQPNIDNINI